MDKDCWRQKQDFNSMKSICDPLNGRVACEAVRTGTQDLFQLYFSEIEILNLTQIKICFHTRRLCGCASSNSIRRQLRHEFFCHINILTNDIYIGFQNSVSFLRRRKSITISNVYIYFEALDGHLEYSNHDVTIS